MEGEKFSRISWFCGYLRNLGAWCSLAWHERAICESFLHENLIFHQCAKIFSLERVSRYMVCYKYIRYIWKVCDYALSFILSNVSRQRFDHLDMYRSDLKSSWESIDIVLKLVRVNSYCELSNCQKHVIDPILISAHLE